MNRRQRRLALAGPAAGALLLGGCVGLPITAAVIAAGEASPTPTGNTHAVQLTRQQVRQCLDARGITVAQEQVANLRLVVEQCIEDGVIVVEELR